MRYHFAAVPQFKIEFGGRTLALPTGSHLVGRMSDWSTLDDDLTSRYHSRLHVTERDLAVEDLDSSNGTYLNGQKLAGRVKTPMGPHGDNLRIGREVIAIISDGSLAPVDDPMDSLRKTIGPHEETQFPQLISQAGPEEPEHGEAEGSRALLRADQPADGRQRARRSSILRARASSA